MLAAVWASAAAAYETYTAGGGTGNCAQCHGDFNGPNYTSLKDGTAWGDDLMAGHISFIDGDSCGTCHGSGPRSTVFLNLSSGPTRVQGCVGCHGRDEDITPNDGAFGGPGPGRGDGLRAHHAAAGVTSCAGCHAADAVQVGEGVRPFNYLATGGNVAAVVAAGPCADRFFGPDGLDNDGDDLTDAADPDCAPDSDGDGLVNNQDNCVNVANATQLDTDIDGIGNICDGDFDQTCSVNFGDLGIMKGNFFLAGNLETDMNGDNATNFGDLGILKAAFFLPPGPSGIPNFCAP